MELTKLSPNCSTGVSGCKAYVRVLTIENLNKWVITKFSNDYNQKLVAPAKRVRMCGNRQMPAKDLTEAFSRENLRTARVPSIFGGAARGFDDRDCWNYLKLC